jgi:8-oxo-dGTP pyrophosphatase MutT (NUDIX family)
MTMAIRPAATVVVLRDGEAGPEVLLVARTSKAGFARGAWVFPGGVVDNHELAGRDQRDAAQLAAVRECREEAGLNLVAEDLLPVSHWLTPEQSPKRFATWFFLYHSMADEAVLVDGGEIVDYRWAEPRVLLDEHRQGQLKLLPPTYVTLLELCRHQSVGETVAAYRRRGLRYFQPRFAMHGKRMCFLYQEDAGYDSLDPEVAGPRHRGYMDDSGCHYECNIGLLIDSNSSV